jgi:hypothetical protein
MLTNNVRASLLATTAVLTLIASASAGPNLVLDPSFETGAPWTLGGNGLGGPARTGASALVGGCVGGGCVVVNPASGLTGTAITSQTINLQPGIYQGSFYYSSAGFTPAVNNNQLAVSLGNNTPINQSDIPAAGYTQYSFISAASGGPTSLRFGIRQDPGFSEIDDVVLELVDDGQGNNIAAAAQTVAVQASRDFLDRLHDRFDHAGSPIATASVRETVLASNGAAYANAGGKYRAFMSVFGSNGEWDDSSASADRRGLSAGFEFAAARGLDLGIAVALSRTDFDTRTLFTANSAEASEYLGAIYAHWSAASAPIYVNAIVGYGHSSNDMVRLSLVGLGSAVARDVDSSQWFGSAEIGWDWSVSQRLTLTPFARVDTAIVDQDGYAETGFGLFIPAVVSGEEFDATRSIVGLRGEADLDIGKRGARLGAKVGWAHEFDQDRFVTFSETTGPVTFTGVGTAARPDEDSVVAGANLEVGVSDTASLYAGYNGNYGDTQEIHAGEVGLRVTW